MEALLVLTFRTFMQNSMTHFYWLRDPILKLEMLGPWIIIEYDLKRNLGTI